MRSGFPEITIKPSGACRVGSVSMPSRANAAATSSRPARRVLTRSVSLGVSLLKRTQRSVASNPYRSSHRATSHSGCEWVMPRYRSAPARSDVDSGRSGSGSRLRSRSVARRTAFPEPCCARPVSISRKVNGVVDDGGGWHTIKMQELVEAEAQDVKNIAVDRGERAPREMFDEDVEAAAPALGAGDDLRCECAVAFVGQLPTTQRKCCGKVSTSFGHCAERVIRRNAGGGGHQSND